MAEVKPLRLRAEKIGSRKKIILEEPYVDVLVSTEFFVEQEIYSYALIEGAEAAAVGDLLSVPFGRGISEGVVVKRTNNPPISGEIKAIHGLISKRPVFSLPQIEQARALAKRYSAKSWDFLSVTAPPFSPVGEKRAISHQFTSGLSEDPSIEAASDVIPSALRMRILDSTPLRDLVILPAHEDSHRLIISLAILRASIGKVVIVLPTARDLERCSQILSELSVRYISLHSAQSKSERYASYLLANSLNMGIVLSLRNGVFLDLGTNDSLFVFNEVESHHYERKSPTWNTRDVALLRSKNSSLLFLSNSPSVEIVNQVKSSWLTKYEFPKVLVKRATFLAPDGGEPSIFPLISQGLESGNVLISVAQKGYINGFSCKKCRSDALCECGGKLAFLKQVSDPRCSLCSSTYLNWACVECGSREIWATSRGIERDVVEYARAFPKTRILRSSGDEPLLALPDGPSLVFATSGAAPFGRYSAIIIQDAQLLYSRVGLRSQEEARSHWFTLLSQLGRNGIFHLTLPSSDPISQGLMRSQPFELAERELVQRFAPKLPPFFRTVVIGGVFSELESLSRILRERDFESFNLARTSRGNDQLDRLLVKVPTANGEAFSEIISSTQRIRSSQKKPLFTLKFDSFSVDS